LVKYLSLIVSQVLVINPVITQEYSLQEEIPKTVVSIVILIEEDPKAALNREHD
jgi:hypothetical protein